MKIPEPSGPRPHLKPPWWRSWLVVFVALVLALNPAIADDSALTKYQVEAVFLYNFAKYVDWPDTAFLNATSPITIGVVGADPFGESLQHTVEGKIINGRTFYIRHLAADSDPAGCQILFISDFTAARAGKVLDRAAALPILTVGEGGSLGQGSDIIDFILRADKVRLEIDLAAARKAGLTISSRLLAVADTVKGKLK